MNLDDITAYTSALEAITAAVEDLSPELAAEALRFVLRVVEPVVIARPQGLEPKALPAPRVVEPVVMTSAEVVADHLVAQGWDYPTAAKAAAAAVLAAGPGADSSLEVLVEEAKRLEKPKRRTREEAAARHANGGHIKIRRQVLLDDAVAFVAKHPKGARTADYAAKCGLTISAAGHRLRTAGNAGLLRLEGKTISARWFLANGSSR